MQILSLILLFLLLNPSKSENINKLFEKINSKYLQLNTIAAKLAWDSSLHPGNPKLVNRVANYQKSRIAWQQNVCDKLAVLNEDHLMNSTQRRQTYLLCRGPKYTYDESRKMSSLYEELQCIYSDAKICIPTPRKPNATDIEDAILNYLTAVKQFLNSEDGAVAFAAKIAVTDESFEIGNGICLKGEEEVGNLMKISRNEEVLRFIWFAWREMVGVPMKKPYKELVELENVAARRNGYTDIGASWRDDLEIPNLRQLCRNLYNDMKPLYSLLHGVVRFYLRKQYGEIVEEKGPIPAHLLGNLWAQNWEPLVDLIVRQPLDVEQSIRKLNWTVEHMVKRAEDFYQSIGLPAMTDKFWRESVFSRDNNSEVRCHGTAADMFQDGDYRLLYCSGKSSEDMYVIHHEMGHIQYYMAYAEQPALFRQANAALHETIGDTIMYGVLNPQHLHRLGLINDSLLFTDQKTQNDDDDDLFTDDDEFNLEGLEDTEDQKYNTRNRNENANKNYDDFVKNSHLEQNTHDLEVSRRRKNAMYKVIDPDPNDSSEEELKLSADEVMILKLGLNKLPQIPFALLIDEYRWRYFEGDLNKNSLNKEFWDLAWELQGVVPPGERSEEYFDVGAKFHVPDNTPFIRYYLSSYLQHQLFEALCKAAVFGRRHVSEKLPSSIKMHRCDIYGSKAVGRMLKDFMSRGHSQNWRKILTDVIGESDISADALKRYYRPLYQLLLKITKAYKIPIGW